MHSQSMLHTMVNSQAFCIITLQPHIETTILHLSTTLQHAEQLCG